jgi:hypothetical protein
MTVTPITPTDPLAGVSDAIRERITAAEEGLATIQRAITQRDWLLITQALDKTRKDILEDGGLRLLALAWVKEKNAHGGASWDVLLDMTDDQLLEMHGFPTDDEVTEDAPSDTDVSLGLDLPTVAGE